MCFAGHDKLHRALRIGEQTQQALRVMQQQIRPFVGGKTPRKTQCQGVGVKDIFYLFRHAGRGTGGFQLSR